MEIHEGALEDVESEHTCRPVRATARHGENEVRATLEGADNGTYQLDENEELHTWQGDVSQPLHDAGAIHGGRLDELFRHRFQRGQIDDATRACRCPDSGQHHAEHGQVGIIDPRQGLDGEGTHQTGEERAQSGPTAHIFSVQSPSDEGQFAGALPCGQDGPQGGDQERSTETGNGGPDGHRQLPQLIGHG